MQMKCLLALDLSVDISWAIRAPDGSLICGTNDIGERYKHDGIRFWLLRIWLTQLSRDARNADTQIEIVFKESDAKVHRLWLPHLEEFCEHTDTPFRGVSAGQIKKFIAGHGGASKEAVAAAIRKLGYAPANDSEAVVVALLLFAEAGHEKEAA